MLGCVGSRVKIGSPSSVAVEALQAASCGVSSVALSFDLSVPEPSAFDLAVATCSIQRLESAMFGTTWVTMSDVGWHRRECPADSSAQASQRIPMTAAVHGLAPEQEYTLRIRIRGDAREQFFTSKPLVCRTSDRPNAFTTTLSINRRWAHQIEVEWTLPDPVGAPVLECEAQCRPDAFMAGWAPCDSDFTLAATPSTLAERGAVVPALKTRAPASQKWQATVRGLKGSTAYVLRTRARNEIGWSVGYSPELLCRTSDEPAAPYDFELWRRRPDSVAIRFTVDDPEGAPVRTCTAQVSGVMGYSNHPQCHCEFDQLVVDEEGYNRNASRRGLCTLSGLQPETQYCVRLWVENDAGTSRQPSLPMQLSTSTRPEAPTSMRTRVGPRSVEAEWDLADPAGACVQTCELEYCRDSYFGAWEVAKAEPLAVVVAGVANDDAAVVAAAMATAEVTGTAVVVRRWRIVLNDLPRETAYMLRARACNCVGWSPSYSRIVVAKTSDRPPPPQNLRCVARFPSTVQLELTVAEVLGTAPVTDIHVEQSGSLSWSEVKDLEVTKLPSEDVEGSRWSIVVTLGCGPGIVHKLRAWASNTFGRCAEPSAICLCRTSDEPTPPSACRCVARSPHALHLEWTVDDPEGAPVHRFDVRCHKDSAFASWQAATCPDTLRQGKGARTWRCVMEQLEPSSSYRVCVRALNEVGWSKWHVEEKSFATSSVPKAVGAFAVHCHEARDERVGAGVALGRTLVVDMTLEDPEGAPVVACMVKRHDRGSWALARRRGETSPGVWRAVLPPGDLSADGKQACLAFDVRAANAVGWNAELRTVDELRWEAGTDGDRDYDGINQSAADLAIRELRSAFSQQEASKERVRSLLEEAAARGDRQHSAALAMHSMELENKLEVLREASQQLDPEVCASGEDQGAILVAQLHKVAQRPQLLPDASAAANVLSLLLRAYLWLETAWHMEFRSLSEGITQMTSIPASEGRILHQWAKQHQAWSENFDAKVGGALPDGLATATQLLATLFSGRKLESFRGVKDDLVACLTLVSAAERQLKRLRQSHRILHAAERTSCHDFQKKTVLQKLETTALGVITMLVLPVPGTIEVGTVSIGMLWLQDSGDASNHLVLEHPTGIPLAPMLQRLGSSPPPRAAVILAGWASGGHKGVVLVHNATARRITATVVPDTSNSVGAKAYQKFSEAHPLVKLVGNAMAETDGGDHMATILPTDVALIQVPAAEGALANLEFAYGPASHPARSMGRARIGTGTAVTFVELDSGLQVSNMDGVNCSVANGAVNIVNNDLAPIELSVFRAAELRSRFESALLTEVFQPGEQRQVPLPQPCIGRIFQVEVCYDNAKTSLCEVRPGQCIMIERFG